MIQKSEIAEMSRDELETHEHELWEKINKYESIESYLSTADNKIAHVFGLLRSEDLSLDLPNLNVEQTKVTEKREEAENLHHLVEEELSERIAQSNDD